MDLFRQIAQAARSQSGTPTSGGSSNGGGFGGSPGFNGTSKSIFNVLSPDAQARYYASRAASSANAPAPAPQVNGFLGNFTPSKWTLRQREKAKARRAARQGG